MFRIAIANPDELLTRRLVAAFSRVDGLTVVGTALDRSQTLDLVRRTQPDVVVIGPALTHPGGLGHGIATIRLAAPDTRVVVMSGETGDATEHGAYAAGADGFLANEGPGEQLPTSLRWFIPEEDQDFEPRTYGDQPLRSAARRARLASV